MSRSKWSVTVLLVMLSLGVAGCDWDYQALLQTSQPAATPLLRVEINFTDDEQVTCYVESLGMGENDVVYVGGPSLKHMYDRDGNIIGAYNYQRVLYMTILPEEPETD